MNWFKKLLKKEKTWDEHLGSFLHSEKEGYFSWWHKPVEYISFKEAVARLFGSLITERTFYLINKYPKKKYSLYKIYKNAKLIAELKVYDK